VEDDEGEAHGDGVGHGPAVGGLCVHVAGGTGTGGVRVGTVVGNCWPTIARSLPCHRVLPALRLWRTRTVWRSPRAI